MADGDDNDAMLSDVEDEQDSPPMPIVIGTGTGNSSVGENVSVERFREVVAELERERKAREEVEKSKSELEVRFNRLKALAHDAVKKRDENSRQKDEVLRANEKLSADLAEVVKEKDELVKEKGELVKQLEESVKAKDSSKSEIETAAHMLVTGIDKISGKVNNIKNFSAGGLPRSQKYTGLAAVAYGVIKRTNEIVDELVRQIELTAKSRNEAREQMEHRNYEIAIEVSELEAKISGLRDDVSKRDSVVEGLEKSIDEKNGMIEELERELNEKRDLVNEYGNKLRNLESRMDSQRPLLVDQLSHVSKILVQMCGVIKIIDNDKKEQLDLSDSMFLPQETDLEDNIRASLAGLETINELSSTVLEKAKDFVAEKSREVKSLNETVSQLIREKEHIGSLLRSALSRRMSSDLSSKTNELFKVAENGLRESGINYKFSSHSRDEKVSSNKDGNAESEDGEISTLAGALENIIKQSQIEIIELQHTVDELRAESVLLKEHADAQSKELLQRKQQVEELQEKERVANENVEGLMMDVAAAEEEITRWKVAAQQEAEAGKGVEQEYVAQLSTIRQELEEAKQAVIESEKKLKFKEETAAAAMAARDAAETSLRLADTRATRLRERVEELTKQLEGLDTRKISSNAHRSRYVCWPWQWLGLDPIGGPRLPDTHQNSSNEMELSEPLI